MLAVSDSIKNAYNQYTTQRKSYIRVGNNSFFVQNLDVAADCYKNGNIIGNAIAKIAKFDIETDYVKGIDEFELFDGIWTGNQYEYVSLGTFKLFNEEGTDDFFSSVIAYDKLVLFNKEYDPLETEYPTTLFGLLQNVCLQAGVELENNSIPNGEQPIEENLFVEKESLKSVLNSICKISGNFGIISQDKVKLLLKGTKTIDLSKYQLSKPEYKRTTWKINQVVLGMTDVEGEYVVRQDDDDIAKNGVHKLVINDNPFVYTQELRERYIDNLFNQLNGFGYVAFSTKWEGLPFVEIGDLANVDGKESIVLRYNLKSPKGLESTLEAPSIIDSVVKYVDNSNSINNRLSRTEYTVDKANKRIDAVVQTQEDLSDTLIPLATSNGVELKLEKSAGQPLVEFELEGNSKQDSYEGKNLFNLGLVYSSYNPSDRGFTLKSVFGSTVISADNLPKIMKPNTTYTIKVISKIIEKPTTIGSNITYDLALYRPESDTHSSFWRDLNTYEKSSKNVGDVTTAYKSFTTPSDLTNLTIRGYSFRGNNDGSTTYTGIGEVEIQEIMLVEGTYNESNFPEFEPYVGGTQSPNPDYPQEITVIEGDLSLKNISKNEFNINLVTGTTSQGVTSTIENGKITLSGATSTNWADITTSADILLGAGTYTFSIKEAIPVNLHLVVYSKSTGNRIENFSIEAGNRYATKEYDEAVRVKKLFINGTAGTETNGLQIDEIQLEKGSVATEYEPYQETITEIDLQGNFIAKLPNGTKDRLYLNQGHLYLEKNISRIFVNITSTTVYNGKVIGIFGVSGKRTTNTSDNGLLYSHAVVERSFKENTCYENPANVCFVGNSTDTLETLKAKYDNGTLYFVLATPVIHDLGEYSIETLEGNSTIRAISNLEPSNMYCKYIRDIEGLDVFQTKNDMADYYNKFETDSRISIETDSIVEQVGSIASLVDANGKAIETVNNRVTEQITSTQAQIEVVENKVNNGVETLKNSLVTININGIQVSTNLSKISTVMTNDTFAVQDSSGTYLARFGYDEETESSIAEMDNLTVGNYFVAGVHRQEKFQDEETNEWRTGFFYIGGSE